MELRIVLFATACLRVSFHVRLHIKRLRGQLACPTDTPLTTRALWLLLSEFIFFGLKALADSGDIYILASNSACNPCPGISGASDTTPKSEQEE